LYILTQTVVSLKQEHMHSHLITEDQLAKQNSTAELSARAQRTWSVQQSVLQKLWKNEVCFHTVCTAYSFIYSSFCTSYSQFPVWII